MGNKSNSKKEKAQHELSPTKPSSSTIGEDRMTETMSIAVEGSSELCLTLPNNDVWRMMNYAETYLASCYAIWIAANDDKDERAIAMRDQILSLTHAMMNEVESETVH